ncbi:tyrosine-type recombinase/integrase [Natrarchaeobaculum aegyptiacum]|uniref:Recombinase XerD n=1 Tax=Natrarchaeobaculum aegyptiacum TaxID=745377 RepID=A0A2Z2HS87_9EURY|nr:recombinase XerD [Natrarchaeobaculum aegyptiacum]ARS88945.1 recombinase XerD [Natrarchaeobaculum aegyptiacum]
MTETTIDVTDAIDGYLQRKAVGDPDGPGAGTYASNAESILRRFADWLERERDLTTLAALEPIHLRAYANDLSSRVDRGEYTASSARTYYAVVRAFCSWCVRGGLLESNPAAADVATVALPSADSDTTGRPGREPDDSSRSTGEDTWAVDVRRTLEAHVRERARAVDDLADPEERLTRLREYALVTVLAHSGARGSELFRVPTDERRTGATWDDVDFYDGTIRVLGRSQRLEEVDVLGPARMALRRYRIVLDPPTNDWPLFPTRHAPSIARHVRETLSERGYDDAEIDDLFDAQTASELARDRAIAPPAITAEGARSVLRRLCERAGLEVTVTPRGVGDATLADESRREARSSTPLLRTTTERTIAVPADWIVADGRSSSVDPDRTERTR